MDMGKYVAVGVLAVIVLAAVTYEAPKDPAASVTTEASPDGGQARVEGAFGALTPPAPVREPATASPATTAPIPTSATPEVGPATTSTTLPVSAPRDVKSYTLKAGQTLRDAAQELLGDRGRWRELYEANRDKIPDPNRVRAGLKLIFDASAPRAPAASAPRSGTPCPIATPTPPPGGSSYTVVKGDTLYSIARKQLGSGGRWREIKTLNQLPGENVIPGTVLLLPAR